MVYQVSSIKEI